MGRKATWYLLDNLFVLFSLAALVAAFACHYAPEASLSWGWIVAGMATPVLFGLNVVLLIWWLVRRRWFVALVPLVAVIVGGMDFSYQMRLPRLGDPEKGDLRVATLNVHGFQSEPARILSANHIAQMLEQEQIDVACLQEALDDAEFSFEILAKPFQRTMPYYVRELSMACFSRYPIVGHKYVRFPDSNQSYMHIDVQVGDRTVRFVSVHLQTTGISTAQRHFKKLYGCSVPIDTMCRVLTDNAAIRMIQTREIRHVIDTSSMPVIVAGDFNDTPYSKSYRTMSHGLTDAFRTAGHGWGGTFRSAVRIDYILHNDYFEATDYYVLHRTGLSDHDPVIGELRFTR